ncbi:SAM-dependent methyltransferase [Rhodococcus sp. ACS1]|uniref:Cyclopropane-fatty-acyl-phospholipid synthase n=1 Tax=Rhodococcus koreensis TaxID=99653 RepID=A0A1H4XWD2_9NOCA|nr:MULTISPECIES: class I SAM-dependent methyltransferase [Rhodococcus]PBC48436.1 SAM-dependent methyltransferase [Rhodococcus sp. ACS1]SED09983.1 cyclopropane-fatty-acyl-phospholipid synthase [Rhodococcus koreensis]
MRRNKDTDTDGSPAVSTAGEGFVDEEFTGEDPGIDNRIWPGLADVPTGVRAAASAKVADRLFRRAAADLDVRIEYPDGTLVGARREQEILPRMIIRNPDAFARRVGTGGLIGFGESYMAGDWTSPDLAAVLSVFASRMATLIPRPLQRLRALYVAKHPAQERNTEQNTRSNISRHYDLSNEMFETFLDETLTYSSALFSSTPTRVGQVRDVTVLRAPVPQVTPKWDDFADAQRRKIDRLLDEAGVGAGTRLLEIGTGWGELCIRAAERGAVVRSVTLSSEQQSLARRRVAEAGHSDAVQIDLLDYRNVDGEYDAIVSVEMIEAVGHQYWATYFRVLDKLLASGGRVALQAITMPHDRMLQTRNTYTWVHKYIFPGGFLPSTEAIESVTAEHTGLRVRERLSMGQHYAETLRLWKERFAAHSTQAEELGFDETFRRMWHFYLCYSEAGFRSGYIDVQQLVLDKTGARP